jgi:dihydrofolate reductase
MRISMIVAVAENGTIGRDGQLPWRLSADLKRFKQLTWGRPLIMGRNTFDSIGRPLPGRRSIVLTHRPLPEHADLLAAASLSHAFELADDADEVFVIGGRSVFIAALPLAERLYWTRVHAQVQGDVRFPAIDWTVWQLEEQISVPADSRNEFASTFQIWRRQSTD